MAYWDMETLDDEGDVRDLAGTYDLDIIDSPAEQSPVTTPGIIGSAYEFTEAGQYFVSHTPFPDTLLGGAAKSISAWAWITDSCVGLPNGQGCPVAAFGTSFIEGNYESIFGSAFMLAYHNGIPLLVGGDGVYDLYANTGWAHDEWRHVVGTYENSTMKIYVDGVLAGTKQVALNTGNALPYFVVGMDSIWKLDLDTSGKAQPGTKVDEVKIYDFALSAAQVSALYELGVAP